MGYLRRRDLIQIILRSKTSPNSQTERLRRLPNHSRLRTRGFTRNFTLHANLKKLSRIRDNAMRRNSSSQIPLRRRVINITRNFNDASFAYRRRGKRFDLNVDGIPSHSRPFLRSRNGYISPRHLQQVRDAGERCEKMTEM